MTGRVSSWDDPGCVKSLSCVDGLHSLGCPAHNAGRTSSPAEVVTGWFASDLTWHSFQTMSDDEMAAAVLDALHAAGFLVMPATAFDPYQQTTDATGFSTTPKERP